MEDDGTTAEPDADAAAKKRDAEQQRLRYQRRRVCSLPKAYSSNGRRISRKAFDDQDGYEEWNR